MRTNNNAVMSEYDARRLYLATAPIGIADLFKKAIQLMQFVTDNRITKEDASEKR